MVVSKIINQNKTPKQKIETKILRSEILIVG